MTMALHWHYRVDSNLPLTSQRHPLARKLANFSRNALFARAKSASCRGSTMGSGDDPNHGTRDLRMELTDSFVGGGRDIFLPEGNLKAILSSRGVQAELEECDKLDGCPTIKNDSELAKLVEFIRQRAAKTFAALVVGGSLELIDLLYLAERDDTEFPFSVKGLSDALEDGLKKSHLECWKKIRIHITERRRSVRNAFGAKFDHFVEAQRHFTAPVFGGDKFEQDLAPERPLPFLPQGDAAAVNDRGGFGEVRERLLHRDHLQISDGKTLVSGPLKPWPTLLDS